MLWRHFLHRASLFLGVSFSCQVDKNWPGKSACVDMGTEYKQTEWATLTKMGVSAVCLFI